MPASLSFNHIYPLEYTCSIYIQYIQYTYVYIYITVHILESKLVYIGGVVELGKPFHIIW